VTYFGFLTVLVGVPLLVLVALTIVDRRRKRVLRPELSHRPAWAALAVHVAAALIYTTPWDNYLVATRVWYYNPALVAGVTLGWVPLEEYIFFVAQTCLTGLWLLWLARRLPSPGQEAIAQPALRQAAALVTGLVWIGAVVALAVRSAPATYLALEIVWFLPPVILQLSVGADVLWRRRRLVSLALFPAIAYLSAADAVAIDAGTWTINPGKSTGILLGGVLPLEELVFFTLTNALIVFGMVLFLSIDPTSIRPLVRRRPHRTLPSST